MKNKIKSLSWFYWIAAIDLFFIIATTLHPYLPESIKQILNNHLNLGVENNLATWWSGLNLLALALLAYELFSTRGDRTRIPWLILALIFAGLSLDEIGSIHERVGSMKTIVQLVAAGGLVLLYALGLLYQSREGRTPAIKILIAFLLFGTVFLQEYLEHSLIWPEWLNGIRTGVEESTELAGMLLLLSILIGQRRPGVKSLLAAIPDPLKMQSLLPVMGAGLVLNTILSLLSAGFTDFSKKGNPAVWYPMSMFFLLFCISIWIGLRTDHGKRSIWLLLAAYALVSSLAVVYLVTPRQELSKFNQLGLLSNFYFQYACQWVILALIYWKANGSGLNRNLAGLVLPALSLLVGVMIDSLSIRFIVAGLFACSMVSLFHLVMRRETEVVLAGRYRLG